MFKLHQHLCPDQGRGVQHEGGRYDYNYGTAQNLQSTLRYGLKKNLFRYGTVRFGTVRNDTEKN